MKGLQQLCDDTLELVNDTGLFIQGEASSFSSDKIETKGLHDFVSYVDKEAEIKLVEGLGKILPEAGFITE